MATTAEPPIRSTLDESVARAAAYSEHDDLDFRALEAAVDDGRVPAQDGL